MGPPTLGPASLFGRDTPTRSTMAAVHWHMLLPQSDILQVLGGVEGMHALDGLGGFTRVLEVNTKI